MVDATRRAWTAVSCRDLAWPRCAPRRFGMRNPDAKTADTLSCRPSRFSWFFRYCFIFVMEFIYRYCRCALWAVVSPHLLRTEFCTGHELITLGECPSLRHLRLRSRLNARKNAPFWGTNSAFPRTPATFAVFTRFLCRPCQALSRFYPRLPNLRTPPAARAAPDLHKGRHAPGEKNMDLLYFAVFGALAGSIWGLTVFCSALAQGERP